MHIETKFNISDVVYVCKNNSFHEIEPCKTCNGVGTVIIKGKSFCCPNCNGNRRTHTKFVKKYVPEKRTIRKIKVSVYETNKNTGIDIRYETKTHSRNGIIRDDRNVIFATKEEAEARCRELNGGIKSARYEKSKSNS